MPCFILFSPSLLYSNEMRLNCTDDPVQLCFNLLFLTPICDWLFESTSGLRDLGLMIERNFITQMQNFYSLINENGSKWLKPRQLSDPTEGKVIPFSFFDKVIESLDSIVFALLCALKNMLVEPNSTLRHKLIKC